MWQEDEEGDVSSYWRTLRKREVTGNWKWEHKIALYVRTPFGRGCVIVRQTAAWMGLSAYVHCFQFRPIKVSYNMWNRRRTYQSAIDQSLTNTELWETYNRQQAMAVRRACGTGTWELWLVLAPSDNEKMAQMLWVDWQRKWNYFDRHLCRISKTFVSWQACNVF